MELMVLAVSAQVKSDKDLIEALVQPIETADRLFQELQTRQKDVNDLEYKLDLQGPVARSLGDIRLELTYLQSKKDNLHGELEKLREEQRYMEADLSNIQMRWHSVREEKIRTASIFRDFERTEEELECLTEEMSQIVLDEKFFGTGMDTPKSNLTRCALKWSTTCKICTTRIILWIFGLVHVHFLSSY